MKIVTRGKTQEYGRFEMAKGNREYKPHHMNELADSIADNNLLELFPIICVRRESRLLVYDGQHRLAACKKLGIPVPYVIVDSLSPEDISRMNADQKGWNTKDYVQHFVSLGKAEYIELNTFVNRTGVPITLAINMLGGNTIQEGGAGATKMNFRHGRFRVKTLALANEIVQIMNAIKESGCSFTTDRSFVKALFAIHNTKLFDVSRLIPRLKYMPLEKAANWIQYVQQIDRRYNYRALRNNKVPIEFEATKTGASDK